MPSKIETFLVFLPVIAGVGFFSYAVYVANANTKANEAAAAKAGFVDYAEMTAAQASGIKDGAAWHTKVAEDATKHAAEQKRIREQEERAKKEWDAQAPARAAAAAKQAEVDREAARPPAERVSLSGQSWSTGGFGSIGMMTFTINNGNDYPIKDVTVVCSFYGNSGTFLGERLHTVYEVVKAKAKRRMVKENIGFIPSQSARGGCIVGKASRY